MALKCCKQDCYYCNGDNCYYCAGKHSSSEPHLTGKCDLCGGVHNITRHDYTTGPMAMDGDSDVRFRVGHAECPVVLKWEQTGREGRTLWKQVLQAIRAPNAVPPGCFHFRTRYDELRTEYRLRERSFAEHFAEHIMRKAQATSSRLYSSTPEAVKNAIRDYEEFLKSDEYKQLRSKEYLEYMEYVYPAREITCPCGKCTCPDGKCPDFA